MRKKTPFVSVLMPVYNAAKYLSEAVTSILNQSFEDFELLAVDDGSQDRSRDILNGFARRDARIRPLCLPHKGLVAALNEGLSAARGQWVARMDADDVAVSDRLEAQLGFAERHQGVSVIGTYAWYIGETGRPVGLYCIGPTTLAEFDSLMRGDELIRLIHPTILMDRQMVVGSGGYDERFRHVEDVELYNRLADRGYISLVLPQAKLCYRVHEGSVVMRSHLEMSRMYRFVEAVVAARRRAAAPIAYDDFLRQEQDASLLCRATRRRVDLGAYLYRRGGVHFATGNRTTGAACVAMALCLTPRDVSRKLRTQVIPLWTDPQRGRSVPPARNHSPSRLERRGPSGPA